ncbi:hypothetical protein JMJ77_0008334 [Colletotrichum scovillei]|uniref:Uncharacterized protein n=1 Tax=Colletotrichum scovillei TaxID=1209932 RepID=A0A9P7UGC2_9PEZI|nr:hypothetical protein JMJ77_0008334 [Colletotrichum scovillei]KAG7075360.1 hypothetical protein JMJ76_0011820 [Colletotrichum scovillei]KAG7082570.1 hypothetical protein JMJ78_0004671 [Colletotrichum scovillei]
MRYAGKRCENSPPAVLAARIRNAAGAAGTWERALQTIDLHPRTKCYDGRQADAGNVLWGRVVTPGRRFRERGQQRGYG